MSNGKWSRGEKIALAGFLVAVATCAAAIAVIPQVQRWLGLGSLTALHSNSNLSNETPANTRSNRTVQDASIFRINYDRREILRI